MDECSTNPDTCDVNADCQNTVGSYDCSCKPGFTGNGRICNGEQDTLHNSDKINNTSCWLLKRETKLSLTQRRFFFFNNILDTDECSSNSHSCDINAVCTNTPGSYSCACVAGYSGDGRTCVLTGMNTTWKLTNLSSYNAHLICETKSCSLS